jgi:transposase-like protein
LRNRHNIPVTIKEADWGSRKLCGGFATMKKPRRRIDSALKLKIVFEAVRGQKSVVDLAQQYGLHPNQIYEWKKQLENYGILAFDRRIRQIGQFQAKVRRVTRDCLVAGAFIAAKNLFLFS